VARAQLEAAEWRWQQWSRMGNRGPVLISSAQSGEILQLKGCACSALCCTSGSVLKAACTVLGLKRHSDGSLALSQVLPELSTRGGSEQAGLYWQVTASPGWPSAQDPRDTLQLQSGLPCSLVFPALFQLQPSLDQPSSCMSSWHPLLAKLSGEAWPG